MDVIMPSLGAVAEESTLLRWLVQEGDQVEKGQPIFEAESDKATVEVEAPGQGTIGKLLAAPGDLVPAGGVIALLLLPGESMPLPGSEEMVEQKLRQTDQPATWKLERTRRVIASPLARNYAREHHVSVSELTGTGPNGRIIKADVEDALKAMPAVKPLGLTGIRAAIASHMAESAHTTAPVTLTSEVDAEALVALRESLRAEAAEPISYDLLIAIVAAAALKKHPALNSSITPEGIVQHESIHIGVAVDTERGLLVPVLKGVPGRALLDLAADLNAKVRRAQAGKAAPDDLGGGTFTITNLGMWGIDAFTPIVNLPECAILGVGRIVSKPVVWDGEIVARRCMTLSLTFDHRLVDGGPAARFLYDVGRFVETPALLWLR